ncbi:hypothetical protein BJV77DRAFT_561978 [Russula vinacea]|nr:hypothetical protein BJV77DRAFT_561978 [Russula vinacea]
MIQSLVLNSGLCQMSSSPPRPSPSLSSSDLKPCSAEPVYSRDPRFHQASHRSDVSQFLSPGFSTYLFSFTQATRPRLLGWSPEPAHLCRSIPGQCGLPIRSCLRKTSLTNTSLLSRLSHIPVENIAIWWHHVPPYYLRPSPFWSQLIARPGMLSSQFFG